MLDIDSYLKRINYQGRLTPNVEVLQELQWQHATSIAFENLNSFLGLPVSLEADDLQHKLLGEGRGGYCYEQNLLFKTVLEWVGFEVSGLVARVLWNEREVTSLPRSHMLLRVRVDDRDWLVDVGFGAVSPTAPILFKTDATTTTSLETFRLVEREGQWQLQVDRDGWLPMYEFDLQTQQLGDYRVQNWYVSTHPESKFVSDLILARVAEDRRYTLHNRLFTVRDKGGDSQRQCLSSAQAVVEVIRQVFHIDVANVPGLQEKLHQKLFSAFVLSLAHGGPHQSG